MFFEEKVVFTSFADFKRFQEGKQQPFVNCEVLNEKNMVDFSRPSHKRQHTVAVKDQTFFVNPQEIYTASPELSYAIACQYGPSFGVCNGVTADQFLLLLEAICPSVNGLFKKEITEENILSLLPLAFKFNVVDILADCKKVILSKKVKEFSVGELFELYQTLHKYEEEEESEAEYPMKTYVLKAFLEHDDQETVTDLLDSNYSAVPFIGEAFRRIREFGHSLTFMTLPMTCSCTPVPSRRGRAHATSFCGFVCNECNAVLCGKCNADLCPMLINRFLSETYNNRPIPPESPSSSSTSSLSSFSSNCSISPPLPPNPFLGSSLVYYSNPHPLTTYPLLPAVNCQTVFQPRNHGYNPILL